MASFLDARDVLIEHKILSKEQVYQTLVERICRHHQLPICGDKLIELIRKRDEEASTAYPTGIAIPHIRMEGYQDTVVAMAFLQNPIDFDGVKVSWVVLIITDKSSSKIYLNIVAALLKISKSPEQLALLMSAVDGHAVIHHLKSLNIEVKKDLTIADIMITNPISITPDKLLKDLGALMSDKGISIVPVTDSQGKFLGEANLLTFLKVGVPDYIMMLDNLNFLSSFEPLESLFERQDEVKVSEIMEKDIDTITPDASVIEAVFEMIQHKKRHLSVVENGKLVGVVTAMDIFTQIVRA